MRTLLQEAATLQRDGPLVWQLSFGADNKALFIDKAGVVHAVGSWVMDGVLERQRLRMGPSPLVITGLIKVICVLGKGVPKPSCHYHIICLLGPFPRRGNAQPFALFTLGARCTLKSGAFEQLTL